MMNRRTDGAGQNRTAGKHTNNFEQLLIGDLFELVREYLLKGGRLRTFNLLIKVACLVKKVNNIFEIKRSSSKLVSKRR
jgi:hypothetical protein